MSAVDFKEIDRLLHDAEHAKAGADFAKMMGHLFEMNTLASKCAHLTAMANTLDPEHTAPAWEETTLDV